MCYHRTLTQSCDKNRCTVNYQWHRIFIVSTVTLHKRTDIKGHKLERIGQHRFFVGVLDLRESCVPSFFVIGSVVYETA